MLSPSLSFTQLTRFCQQMALVKNECLPPPAVMVTGNSHGIIHNKYILHFPWQWWEKNVVVKQENLFFQMLALYLPKQVKLVAVLGSCPNIPSGLTVLATGRLYRNAEGCVRGKDAEKKQILLVPNVK